MTRTLEEWAEHWNARAAIDDPIERGGCCLDGAPIDAELHRAALIEPWLARLEVEPGHHVLEVGCGSGLLLREIETRVERAVGTDLSEALLRRYSGGAETHVCAAHELPFADGQFDRVVMASVSHYFPSLEYFREVAVELLRVLRTPGILLIADVPLGRPPRPTPHLWYERRWLRAVLESLEVRFSIEEQTELKRRINRRYDVLVRKDTGRRAGEEDPAPLLEAEQRPEQ